MTHIDFLLLVPELFQLALFNILLLYALFFSGLGQNSHKVSEVAPGRIKVRPKQLIRTAYLPTPLQIVGPLSWLIVLTLLFSAILYLNAPVNSAVILTNTFICDDYGNLFKVILCFASAAAIALAIPDKNLPHGYINENNYEFILITYLSILGMLALISSYNFLTLYLSIELQSLCFYMLACMKARSEFSAEAGLKYFILGAFSSAILLFGICLIYGEVGSIYFDDIAALLHFFEYQVPEYTNLSWDNWSPNNARESGFYISQFVGLTLGLICVCISLLFKLAAAPFHAWAPDVYEGSPMNITAFFAITAKIAALAVLLRLVVNAGDVLTGILSLVAIACLVVGTLSAMRQVKIKRLIAFSGIANVGWFLMGLCCGGLDAIILHLIVYIILSITVFSILMKPIHRMSGSKGSPAALMLSSSATTIKHISDLGQVYKTNPMVALALTIALFSLGGIPILAGFYSKYLIINSTIQTSALGLLSIGLISAVFSAFYYIRVIKTLYFSEASSDWFSFLPPTTTNAYIISITTLFTGLFVVYPESISVWLIYISL